GQLDMEKSSNGLELKLRESISHEKSAEIQKGVRNENIPNPFCRQTETEAISRFPPSFYLKKTGNLFSSPTPSFFMFIS
ncbi:hypothetical protein, partial [Mesobacillus sp.]|uniref:hypothetical protein n=1 Tax=Mesobacillus sp. TaxID=2675271 RepID=UPI0039F048CD